MAFLTREAIGLVIFFVRFLLVVAVGGEGMGCGGAAAVGSEGMGCGGEWVVEGDCLGGRLG